MIRVAVADDHQLFAEGLANALSALPDISVSFTASDATHLLKRLESISVDLVLIDLEMPGGGGLEVLRLTKTPCLIVTMHDDPETRKQAMDAGAMAFMPKSAPLGELAAAIRAIAKGVRLPEEPEARRATLAQFAMPELDPGAEALTDREREILGLLGEGVSRTEDLAERLFISPKTVKNHLASIFDKLAVSDRTQAAVEAIRLGLTRSDPNTK